MKRFKEWFFRTSRMKFLLRPPFETFTSWSYGITCLLTVLGWPVGSYYVAVTHPNNPLYLALAIFLTVAALVIGLFGAIFIDRAAWMSRYRKENNLDNEGFSNDPEIRYKDI
jgi:hypothetical protein